MQAFTRAIALVGISLAAAMPSLAQAQDREFCADRPGRGTPPCTLAVGQAMAEVGVFAWDHSADAQSIDDTFNLADTVLRVGVTDNTEVQIGLTGYTRMRSRDRATGNVDVGDGVGDGYLAVRHGLAGDNGPVAIQAFVTLPIGKPPGGAGDWGGGVLLPLNFDLKHGFELALTPEVDAAVNMSGSGRHLAYGGVVGLSHDLVKDVSFTGEVSAFRDNDPDGHETDARLAASLAWQVSKLLQIDFEADLGLSKTAPKHTVMVGFARRIG